MCVLKLCQQGGGGGRGSSSIIDDSKEKQRLGLQRCCQVSFEGFFNVFFFLTSCNKLNNQDCSFHYFFRLIERQSLSTECLFTNPLFPHSSSKTQLNETSSSWFSLYTGKQAGCYISDLHLEYFSPLWIGKSTLLIFLVIPDCAVRQVHGIGLTVTVKWDQAHVKDDTSVATFPLGK